MRVLKDLLSSPRIRGWTAALGVSYINFAFRTTRWQFDDATRALQACLGKGPIIFCVWHGRQLMMPRFWPSDAPLWVVGSTSRDGQLALAAAKRFKLRTIERPGKRVATEAARAMIRVLRSGDSVGITPDGSRGPRMRVKAGVIELAQLSGAPIVPATYSSSSAIALSSWDRFFVPLPFGRGIFTIGAAIHVARTASPVELEAGRRALEDRLNLMTQDADQRVGRRPMIPADSLAGREIAARQA